MKYYTLYESIINQNKIENAIESLLEAVNEFDGGETLPMDIKKSLLQTRLNMVQTQKLSPDEQKQLSIARHKAENTKAKEQLKKNVKISHQEVENYITGIDKVLIQAFGSWWKSHIIKRSEFKILMKQFKKEHPNIAMPLELSDLTETEL